MLRLTDSQTLTVNGGSYPAIEDRLGCIVNNKDLYLLTAIALNIDWLDNRSIFRLTLPSLQTYLNIYPTRY
jgi:hypothetical protein